MGEKEDPLQARKDRLRLSQIALKSIGKSNDSTLAGLIYRNQVATQKNLVGVRSIRRSINKDYSTIGTAEDELLPALTKETIRMNRTSGMSGFGIGAIRANKPFNTASTKFGDY